MIIRKSPY
jgi:hypothetical protein